MADLADVMDALEQIAFQGAYPNGTSSPSVTTRPIDIAQGWPQANDVDRAMAAGRTLVSIFAVPSTTSDVPQPFNMEMAIVNQPDPGTGATVLDGALTLTGSPGAKETITAVVDGRPYGFAADGGESASTVAAALLAEIVGDYPGSTVSGSTVTVAGSHSLEVRIGAKAQVADRIHRQRMQFRIVIWSPTPADRAAAARNIDVALKRNLLIEMPDGTSALVTFQGTNLDDKYENASAYRRDLLFNVMWDTVDILDAYEITFVDVGFSNTALSPPP